MRRPTIQRLPSALEKLDAIDQEGRVAASSPQNRPDRAVGCNALLGRVTEYSSKLSMLLPSTVVYRGSVAHFPRSHVMSE